MKGFNRLGDALLSRFVPGTPAAAGCPPDERTEYRCYNGKRQRSYCTLNGDCRWLCGSWTTIGSC